jgi:Ca2+-binding EF-hand superfamily protein
LLDELGEGALSSELDGQIAMIDPTKTGRLERKSFVDWYDKVCQDALSLRRGGGADKDEDSDDEDAAEREEERQKAKGAFCTVATSADPTRSFSSAEPLADESTAAKFWITSAEFPQLFELLNTTYCEEEHDKTSKRLQKADGKIYMDDFLNWYVDWIFGDDDESSDDRSDEASEKPSVPAAASTISGWGNVFAVKEGSWKCGSCWVTNSDSEATKCPACEALRSIVAADTTSDQAASAVPAGGTAIGPGGFSFGATAGFSFGSSVQGIGLPTGQTEKKTTGLEIGSGGFSFPATSSGFSFAGATSTLDVQKAIPDSSPTDSGAPIHAPTELKFDSAPLPLDTPGDEEIVFDSEPVGENAEKASRVFDAHDKDSLEYIATSQLEQLLDDLGEGLQGDELHEQLILIDPNNSGKIQRANFVAWYCNYVEESNGSVASDNTDDKAAKEEERENAREAFMRLASQDEVGGYWISTTDFPALIESMGSTYCEEVHQKTLKRLAKPDGKINLDEFVRWYADWVFSGDEESVEEVASAEGPTMSLPSSSVGWDAQFGASKEGSWKCETCMVTNKADDTKCVACETPRPGSSQQVATSQPSAASNAAIGPGGFTFGSASGFSFGSPVTVDPSTATPSESTSGFIFATAQPPPDSKSELQVSNLQIWMAR